jgi:hypothetical protein
MHRIGLAVFLLFALADIDQASARPRDDVLAGAFRCAAIADTRTWLDCFYGAAQPARVALGLSPVLAGQAQLASAPTSGGMARDVATRDAVMGEASRCYASGDDRAWLNCYYAAVQPVRVLLGLAHAQAIGGAGPLQSEPPQGNRLLATRRAEAVHMTAYRFDAQGLFTATLDNGQVWRQMPGDVQKARWKKPAAGYAVTVARGALGSTNFSVQDQPILFKVERVR